MANYILVEVDAGSAMELIFTAFNPVKDQDLDLIRPLIEKINANQSKHNFPDDEDELRKMYSDGTPESLAAISTFHEYLPHIDFEFNVVTRVEIYDVGYVESLL